MRAFGKLRSACNIFGLLVYQPLMIQQINAGPIEICQLYDLLDICQGIYCPQQFLLWIQETFDHSNWLTHFTFFHLYNKMICDVIEALDIAYATPKSVLVSSLDFILFCTELYIYIINQVLQDLRLLFPILQICHVVRLESGGKVHRMSFAIVQKSMSRSRKYIFFFFFFNNACLSQNIIPYGARQCRTKLLYRGQFTESQIVACGVVSHAEMN